MRKASVPRIFLFACLVCFIGVVSAWEFRLPVDQGNTVPFDRYAIYYGDFDKDLYQDIYFHGVTKQPLEAPAGFAYFGHPEGGYQSALPWDMTDAALNTCGGCVLAQEGRDYILGDLDGDGFPEILIKGRDESQSSVVLSGREQSGAPQILLEILPSGHVRLPGESASREPYFRDNLRNSDARILNGRLSVDGTGHSLNQLLTAASGSDASTRTKSLSPQAFSSFTDTSITGAQPTIQSISAPPTPTMPVPNVALNLLENMDKLGSLTGEFRVNEMGASTYTIPLALPAGTAGVAPEVALTYSSQGGVSSMGLGWSLAAGSAITRCRQTLQVDGVARAIEFSNQDRFCLDGQRLLVTSGTYGAVGAQYKTEIDSGVWVTSVGGTAGHPLYFEVRAKDGSVSRYGGASSTHNSLLRGRNADGNLLSNRTLSWNLSEFKDSVGNRVVYTYQSAVSHYRLSQIAYGYGASSTADVVVNFDYGTRKRADIDWVGNVRFSDNSRLDAVRILDKNQLVREYRIQYNQAAAGAVNDLMDRVTRIDSCIGDLCVQPLELSWGFASPGAASKGNGRVTSYTNNMFSFGATGFNTHGHPAERITAGDRMLPNWSVSNLALVPLSSGQYVHSYMEVDIDGDGRQDLLILRANTSGTKNFSLYSRLQTLTGFGSAVLIGTLEGDPTVSLGAEDPQLHPVDFNADGRMDLAVYLPRTNEWRTYFSEPQIDGGWRLVRINNFLPANMPANLQFADINSDGLPDLVYRTPNSLDIKVHYIKRTGLATSSRAYSYGSTHDILLRAPHYGSRINAATDINKDGGMDLVTISGTLGYEWIFEQNLGVCRYDFDFGFVSSSESPISQSTIFATSGIFLPTQGAVCDHKRVEHVVVGPYMLDLNGDGLLDIIWGLRAPDAGPGSPLSNVLYRLGTHTGGFSGVAGIGSLLSQGVSKFEIFDSNTNGYQDLLLTGENDIQRLARWNPQSNSFDAPVAHMGAKAGRQTRYTDIDGDGHLDRLTLEDGKLTVARGRPRSNDLVVQFKTGFGVVTNVSYEPLRDSDRYTKLAGIDVFQSGTLPGNVTCAPVQGGPCVTGPPIPAYAVNSDEFYRQINDPFSGVPDHTDLRLHGQLPAQELILSMPVVTRVVSSAGNTSNQLVGVDYSYEGLKIQAGGRGMLGFKKLTTTDMQTGIATTTEYRQDWPFMGTPTRTTTRTHHGQLLSESLSEMAIHGITASNIAAKRTQARNGTQALGPLVLYNALVRDITYDVPQSLLAMPGTGSGGTPPLTENVLKEVRTVTNVDAFGNITNVMVLTLDNTGLAQHVTVTSNTYYTGDGERLGRLQRSTVSTVAAGATTQSRTVDFTYYGYPGAPGNCSGASLLGLLCSEKTTVSDLRNSETPAETLHFYDTFGNKTHTRTGTRVSPYAQFDSKGRFVQATYDVFSNANLTADAAPAGYAAPTGAVVIKTSEVLQRDKFGNVLSARNRVGQSGWVNQVQHATPMGQIYFKGDSTGGFQETTAYTTSDICVGARTYTVTVKSSGSPTVYKCHDRLGRVVGEIGSVVGGTTWRRWDYDLLGRPIRAYEPWFYPNNPVANNFTDTEYDILGRPVRITHPFHVTSATGVESSTRATTTYSYTGLVTEIRHSGHTGGQDRVVRETRDITGQLASVREQEGTNARTLEYAYDALGNLTRTRDPMGNEVINIYNGLGQKVEMRDPDKGTWLYYYNAFGELARQEDARGNQTINFYDNKGRKIIEVTAPIVNPNNVGFGHFWNYDTAANGLGQVGSETKNTNGGQVYSRATTYDSFGRPSTVETRFAGANNQMESHHQRVTYDQFGRVFQTFDAARTGANFTANGVQNIYDGNNRLVGQRDASNENTVYYRVLAMDARGNVTRMRQGGGEEITYVFHPRTGFLTNIIRLNVLGVTTQEYKAVWDHLGNMVSRQDSLLGNTVETFQYDAHNRLTRNTLGGQSVTVNYNAIDNITSKSNVEGGATYQYHATKKHAVTKIGNREFVYDGNGNVIEEKRNGVTQKVFEYTANDLVAKITHNGFTSEFFYGPDNQRYKRIDTNAQNQRTVTLYIGSVEKTHYHDGVVEWKRQVGGVAQIVHRVTNGNPGVGTLQFFQKDHLGSITAITDGAGIVLERMAFDPWGARRTINGSNVWQPTLVTGSALTPFYKTSKPRTHRGYTGHEMLDEMGVIHMNGRIYDATIARFLQADPFIQAPTQVGSFNRYSYVMNNPMNAVDPSGYFFKKVFNKVWKYSGAQATFRAIANNSTLMMVASIALNFIPGCQGWCMVAVQAAFQASTSYAATGSLTAAFQSGAISFVSGAAFMGIGSSSFGQSFKSGAGAHIGRSIAHGMVGGIGSVLQGGKFGHGFASAGLTKFANVNGMFDRMNMGDVKYDGARIITAAAIGGTISERTGGKFANGAITAAMGQALNGNGQNAEKQAKNKQAMMERLAKNVYEAYPELKEHGIEVVYQENIPDSLMAKLTGGQTVGRADISNGRIFVEDLGNDRLNEANILHEMLHIDEARTVLGASASNTKYMAYALLKGTHDDIRKFERDYFWAGLRGTQNPDINQLPWRR